MNSNLVKVYDLCIQDHIPIMRNKTINKLFKLVNKYKKCNILEIGTAYGYSSLFLAQNMNCKKIITLEKNIDNFKKAKRYCLKQKNIEIVNISCFDYEPIQLFDIIIFDGPKSHQDELFEKMNKFLKDDGIIFVDNINFKKFDNAKVLTKNQKKLICKIANFKSYIINLSKKDWKIKIYNKDDGFAVIKRR